MSDSKESAVESCFGCMFLIAAILIVSWCMVQSIAYIQSLNSRIEQLEKKVGIIDER